MFSLHASLPDNGLIDPTSDRLLQALETQNSLQKPPLDLSIAVFSSWIRVYGFKNPQSYTNMTHINISPMVSSSLSERLIGFNHVLCEEWSQASVLKRVSRCGQ